jgi:hypothetical protein
VIEEKYARQQFGRLSGLEKEPEDPAIIRERRKVFTARCRSNAHAERVIDQILEKSRYFPSIADIVQACESIIDPQSTEAIEQSKRCQYCRGDGWRSVDGPYGTSASFPCDHSGRHPGNIGVHIPAAVEKHYQQEARDSVGRYEAIDKLPLKERRRFRQDIPPAVCAAIAPPRKQPGAVAIEREERETKSA